MTPFPLWKLPYLPLRDAVDQMNDREKCKLATSSKQSKRIVQTMKFKVCGYMFHMFNTWCYLNVHESEDVGHSLAFYKTEDDAKSDETSRFQDSQVHVVPDPIEECLNLTRQYQSIFKVGFRSFCVDVQEDPKKTIESIAKSFAEGCDFLNLSDPNWPPNLRNEVDREVLNYVMDHLKLDAGLSLCGGIPNDFRHENAFKFNAITYSDATWISLNDVKSIRNMKHFDIGRTIFDTSDLNQLLHHWVNCDEDTMESFNIYLKKGDEIDKEQLFEGLLTVVIERRSNGPMKLIKCNSPKTRQFILGSVLCSNGYVILRGFKSNGEYSSYLSVFDDLEKERDLKKELADNEQNLKRKEEIEMEIAEIQLRLIDFDF